MAREVVDIEKAFIEFAFRNYTPANLDSEDVKKYIEYIADRRLNQLGLKDNFNVSENPLPWVDEVTNGSSLQNFFEGKVTEYSVVGMTGVFSYE
jgi:ribonucleoside-diphosphate reductase beta chain